MVAFFYEYHNDTDLEGSEENSSNVGEEEEYEVRVDAIQKTKSTDMDRTEPVDDSPNNSTDELMRDVSLEDDKVEPEIKMGADEVSV